MGVVGVRIHFKKMKVGAKKSISVSKNRKCQKVVNVSLATKKDIDEIKKENRFWKALFLAERTISKLIDADLLDSELWSPDWIDKIF
jgi:hypothetical protein